MSQEKLRRFQIFSLLGGMGLLVFLALRSIEGHWPTAGVLLIGFVLHGLGFVLAHRSRHPRLAMHLCFVGDTIAVGGSHIQDGLIHSLSLWVIASIPITAGHLLGKRAIAGYALLAAFFIALAYFGTHLGFRYPTPIALTMFDWVSLRVLAFTILALVSLQIAKETERTVYASANQGVQVQRAHLQAKTHDQEKTRFLEQMSQEIRTPLTDIKQVTQRWSDQSLTGDLRESVQVMDRCADHLIGMLRDIQDLSTIQKGAFSVVLEPFLINTAVRDVVRLFEAKAHSKGLKLELLGPEQDHWVLGDAHRLVQVLSNLVGNAIKFTDEGAVTLSWQALKDAQYRFEVIDQGIGMSSDQLGKLFQDFTQVHLDEGVVRGGTGLGLTISKALANAMDGKLDATSALGEGSVFSLTIGLAEASPLQEAC